VTTADASGPGSDAMTTTETSGANREPILAVRRLAVHEQHAHPTTAQQQRRALGVGLLHHRDPLDLRREPEEVHAARVRRIVDEEEPFAPGAADGPPSHVRNSAARIPWFFIRR